MGGPAWLGTPASAPQSPLGPWPAASATLTVGGPCAGRDGDCEGSLLLRAGATNNAAYILPGVSRRDVVQPQPGAVGLGARREQPSRQSAWGQASPQARYGRGQAFPGVPGAQGPSWEGGGSFLYRLLYVQAAHLTEEEMILGTTQWHGQNTQVSYYPTEQLCSPNYGVPWGPRGGLGSHEVWGAESKCRSNPACSGMLPIRPLYLVLGREAVPTLVPRDLRVGLPGHHTVQVQSLSFSHVGGGGLDVDGLGQSWSCGHSGWVRRVRLPGTKAGTEGSGSDRMPGAHATQTQGWSPVVGGRCWRTFTEPRARALLEKQGRARPGRDSVNLCPSITHCSCHSPGMGPGLEASIVTRTEASRVPELLVTWHEYSPESAGDTWFSLSRGPWT